MRIVIENSVRRQVIRIADWFCENENLDRHTASIEAETEKAILLDFGDRQVWIPRSLITTYNAPKRLDMWQEVKQ